MNRSNMRLLVFFIIVVCILNSCQILDPKDKNKDDIKNDYVVGADVSSIIDIEKAGGVFYENGAKKDIFSILKNNGINTIRIRLWNDPKSPYAYNSGKRNDLTTAIQIAKRAKANGMAIILDLHYSDTWCHPGQQGIPYAWKDKTYSEVKTAVYEYTKSVIDTFKGNNITIDYIQPGNELNSGFIFPHGKLDFKNGDIKIEESFKNFANLLKEGVRAIKENSPSSKIIIHFASAISQNAYYIIKYNFDNIIDKYGVDYDIIGLSYYPYWHGSMSSFSTSMTQISKEFEKPTMIMEYSYGFTTEPNKYAANIFNSATAVDGGYDATVDGQKKCIKDIIEIVISTKNSIGLVYWEPAWIPLDGVGWGDTGTKASWANQALFDYNGNVLPSIKVFNEYKDVFYE